MKNDYRSKIAATPRAALPLLLPALPLVALLALAAGAGCSQPGGSGSGAGGAGAPAAADNAALVARGQTVFTANNCGNCHKLGSTGGGKAPDLTHVGAEAEHTAEWLAAHVQDPKVHNPGSKMPAFRGKIGDEDLRALGAYLAAQK